MSDDLFVYGTLMTGGVAAGMLEPCARRPAQVGGSLYHLPDGYPALVLGGEGVVFGELVTGVEPRRLDVLDVYEGVSEGLFARVRVSVEVEGARRRAKGHPAWAWVMTLDQAARGRRVVSGRWTAAIRR